MKKTRHTFIKLICSLIIVLLSVMTANFIAIADDGDDSKEAMSFTMSVETPENQIDKSATYFDLLVKPGEKQDLKVIVSNTGTKPKKVRVSPTDAITNQNGVIDYSVQPEDYKPDSTLKVPFTSLVSEAQTVDLKAGESKEVIFQLEAPKEDIKGLILGGFVADIPTSGESEQNDQGIKIINKFQLVKAVMLRSNEDKVEPDLALNDVKAALVSYRTAVTANLQNVEPSMFGKMSVEAEVTKKGSSEVLRKETKTGLEMAPNSNFDFPIMWGNEPLEPGDYTLSLVAKAGKHEWPFKKDFTITKEESDELNKEAVDLIEKEGIPMWVWILIGILILLIIVLIIIYLKNRSDKKKKADKKQDSSKRGKSKKGSNKKKKSKK